jgi:hypothetical protein
MKDVQAEMVSLAQQNTAIINAIQKSAQDADQFRTEAKGGIASLTQMQFRFESWLAENSDGWRMRVLGIDPFGAAGKAGPELVDGRDGVGGDRAGADAGSAGVGAGAEKPVLRKWRPTMWELVMAFVLGAVVVSVLAALEQPVAAKVEAKEAGVILYAAAAVISAYSWVKALFGKKAAAGTGK